MDQILKIDIPIKISAPYKPIAVVKDLNGCCPDRPILITVNKRMDGKTNYSCQCACGIWCTNGHLTASAALKEYEDMAQKINDLPF